MVSGTRYYIEDYCDEVVPCDCTLEAWAEWLSKPEEGWRRDEAAKECANCFHDPHKRACSVEIVGGICCGCTYMVSAAPAQPKPTEPCIMEKRPDP
mgnify:CR=1 FL=1